MEINGEIIYDTKPDMSWSIPAIAAEPVTVTCPRYAFSASPCAPALPITSGLTKIILFRTNSGLVPFGDIVVLALDNALLLYVSLTHHMICFDECINLTYSYHFR